MMEAFSMNDEGLYKDKITEIATRIPELVRNFEYRKGPDLYFYQKTMELRKRSSLDDLLNKTDDRFLEIIYSTLVAWDMNSRRAKMLYFSEFKEQILKNARNLEQLDSYRLEKMTDQEYNETRNKLGDIFTHMKLMHSRKILVSNSKALHFVLPHLVMPMDGNNTQRFFFGNDIESKHCELRFLKLFDISREICQRSDFQKVEFNGEWNQSIPKVIDNAILSKMIPKYNKHSNLVLTALKSSPKSYQELENILQIGVEFVNRTIKDLKDLKIIIENPDGRWKIVEKKKGKGRKVKKESN